MARKCSLAGEVSGRPSGHECSSKAPTEALGGHRIPAWTRENDLPNPSNNQLQVGHSHLTLKGIFLDVGRENLVQNYSKMK